jgi:hypothetical protein
MLYLEELIVKMLEKFVTDIYGVYQLINKQKQVRSLVNIVVISKQYLAYYLYRIFAKYINIFEIAIAASEINKLFTYLRIPKEHDRNKPYPLVGTMTNDDQLLDLIILLIIDFFNKLDKFLATLQNIAGYTDFFDFIDMKELPVIIQDLIDLQKLIPGLSVSAIRPNYLDDQQI